MSIISFARRHTFIASFLAVVVILAAIIAGRSLSRDKENEIRSGTKKVSVIAVADYREGSTGVRVSGVVESAGQADLKSQISAPVSVIHATIGDTVYAGQPILELSNADLRAQLAQAQAALDMAFGQRVSGGVTLESARQAAVDRVRDSYNKGYDALNSQVDPLIYSQNGTSRRLTDFAVDGSLVDRIVSTRLDLVTAAREWKAAADSLSPTSDISVLQSALSVSKKNLVTIEGLLGDMLQVVNDSERHASGEFLVFLQGWKTVISGARSSVSGASAAVTSAEAGLRSAATAQDTTSQAQVSASRAGVSNLEAQVAKTVVRSPINGRIASLPLRVGELASPGQLVATVVGEGGLEIKAFASGEDISRIKVGAPVRVEGRLDGAVKSVAPSVSSSNRKVEVAVSVNDPGSSGLVVGRSVEAVIQSEKAPVSSGSGSSSYLLPIQDVKIVPGEAFVFTVDANSRIKRHPVVLGEVRGDFIEVKSGISDDMSIVSPVYELEEGEEVSVQ